MVEPIALGLQICIACHHAKQHENKSSTRENYLVKKYCKHEMYWATACILQHTANFLFISRKSRN